MSIKLGRNIAVVEGPVFNVLGTVHLFTRYGEVGGIWGGGVSPQKTFSKEGHLKKIREKGGHVKYYLY
mgnify:CR=1 FL=1